MAFIKISDLLTFTVGKTYYVTFEGTEYECVAWAGDDGSIVIGNGSIYGGDGGNGEPFSCNSYADGSCYLNTNDYGTYDISISSMEEEIHYIDSKYIKDMYYETDPMEITILGEQVIEGFAIMQDSIYAVENPFSINLVENQTYKVKWDGIIYNCICSIKSGVFYIGNVNYVDMMSGGDIPFCILKFDDTMFIATESTNVSHSIEIITMQSKIIKINEKYLPAKYLTEEAGNDFLTRINPTGYQSLSMNRKPNTTVGSYSTTLGCDNEASEKYTLAEGWHTVASGRYSHAEGYESVASKYYSHAEGYSTEAAAQGAHAEGGDTLASGSYSHAEGNSTIASGQQSHAEGYNTIASGSYSHAEGFYTKASSDYQHAQGKYNIEDTTDKYAHIVGNGKNDTYRSNAHTLDWDGNAWFAGKVYVGGTSQSDGTKLITETELEDLELITVDDIDAICGATIQVASASEVTF